MAGTPASSHGGGNPSVGVVLVASTQIDLSVAVPYTPLWDQMLDTTYDANSIPFAFPAGLGISYDAGARMYTILEDGTWWWDLAITFPQNSAVGLDLEPCFFGALPETTYGPGLGSGRVGETWLHWGAVVRFKAGATPNPVIRVFHAASVSPLMTTYISATIERIA